MPLRMARIFNDLGRAFRHVVVTLDSAQVCFLKLYYGNQRIALDALRQLVLPADAQS